MLYKIILEIPYFYISYFKQFLAAKSAVAVEVLSLTENGCDYPDKAITGCLAA